MKNIFIVFIASAFVASCGEPATPVAPKTVITGVISNPEGNTVWLENYKSEKIVIDTLNDKGEFELKVTLSEAGCYEIVNGKSRSYICLAPADTLSASFDATKIIQSIAYSGKSSALNKYLIEKQRNTDKIMTEQFDSLYYESTDTFLINAEVLFNAITAPFNNIKTDTNINKVLITKEEEALKYEKAALLLDFKYYHKLMTNDTIVNIDKILALTKDINPNKAIDLELKSYRNFLQSYINFHTETALVTDTALRSQPNGTDKAIQITIDKMITDPAVKEYLNMKLKAEQPAF